MSEAEIRACVLDVWRATLGEDPLDDDESYFEAGGHSLLAMRFVRMLHERHGLALSLSDFLRDPSVTGIAGRLSGG